jgi:mannose-6-phosphate isomerase-like protein (cupin superfamily)
MKNIAAYIESGILEAYVLGSVSKAEASEVEQMAAASDEVRQVLNEISQALEIYALANPLAPDPTLKPMLIATIDYTERLQNGEPPTIPPDLHPGSKIVDYAAWLSRPDMKAPKQIDDIHVKIISHTPQAMTAIVWIKEMAPQEVHDDEHEKFLIVEGTCDITIGEDVHQLVPGDVLMIPLYKNHHVKVTSPIACKVILQRIAA